jgi:hypothetical protein
MNRDAELWTQAAIVLLLVAIEHLILGLKFVIAEVIPDVPSSVRNAEIQREKVEAKAYLVLSEQKFKDGAETYDELVDRMMQEQQMQNKTLTKDEKEKDFNESASLNPMSSMFRNIATTGFKNIRKTQDKNKKDKKKDRKSEKDRIFCFKDGLRNRLNESIEKTDSALMCEMNGVMRTELEFRRDATIIENDGPMVNIEKKTSEGAEHHHTDSLDNLIN